jgi:hypothetical protein
MLVRSSLVLLAMGSCLALHACRSGHVDDGASASSQSTQDEEGSSPVGSFEAEVDEEAPTPSVDEVAERSDMPDESPPPGLVEMMRRAGYTDASQADLAEFVHLPPGADGEAGSFGDGQGEARVAFVRYANERYARPHVTDVLERRRILPGLGEAVASDGRYVIHVRAVDRVTADAIAARIADSLGWDEPGTDGQ